MKEFEVLIDSGTCPFREGNQCIHGRGPRKCKRKACPLIWGQCEECGVALTESTATADCDGVILCLDCMDELKQETSAVEPMATIYWIGEEIAERLVAGGVCVECDDCVFTGHEEKAGTACPTNDNTVTIKMSVPPKTKKLMDKCKRRIEIYHSEKRSVQG